MFSQKKKKEIKRISKMMFDRECEIRDVYGYNWYIALIHDEKYIHLCRIYSGLMEGTLKYEKTNFWDR